MSWADPPGTPWWFVLSVAIVGALVGQALRRRLAGGGYRLDDEASAALPGAPALRLTALSALVWGLLAWRLGPLSEWALLPAYLALGVVGVALAWIDADVRRLPLGLTQPAYVLLPTQLALASWASGDWAALLRAVVAGGLTWLVYLGLATLAALLRSGFGYGDVRLAGLIGLATGYLSAWGPVVATYAAFILAGARAGAGVAARRASRRDAIPFGPWMLAGALLAIMVEVEPLL